MDVDYIIIGGGSAGCVLANRLSADAKTTVCLLEAGGEDRNPWIHMPVGYIKTMTNPAVNWMFSTEPQESSGNRPIPVPRGKVLGGSSAINGMLYVRGQPRDFDTWAQLGCRGWSFDEVLPYFKKTECFEPGGDDFHGGEGPVNVALPTERYELLDNVIEAGGQLGYPTNHDYNAATQAGFTYFQATQKNGRRFSAKSAYINPIRQQRKNLVIETRAMVHKLIIEDGRAVAVAFQQRGQARVIKARREIILAAGAIQSPQLLELSGIGDGRRLRDLGVEVIADRPTVGENLQDHYISRGSWRLQNVASLNRLTRGLPLVGEAFKYVFGRRGALTLPAGVVAGFVKSHPDLEDADIQYHVVHATFKDPNKRTFDDFPGLTIGPCQLRPESRGSVHAVRPEATAPPLIEPNFLTTQVDQQVHIAGLKIARELMVTSAMAPFVVEELTPGPSIDDDASLLDFARKTGATVYHPVGTCRMGNDAEAVVDSRLCVNGVAGLRVVDASVMPRLTSGNTNAPVLMIAEKAADMIQADNR